MVQPQPLPEITTYDECPVCKEKETWIKSLAVKEIVAGRLPEHLPDVLHVFQISMRSPTAPTIIGMKVTAGVIAIDACKKCGVVRAVLVEIGQGIATSK